MFSSEEKEIENEVGISLAKAKRERHVWTKQLIFYYNKPFKILAIKNQILPELTGNIY